MLIRKNLTMSVLILDLNMLKEDVRHMWNGSDKRKIPYGKAGLQVQVMRIKY